MVILPKKIFLTKGVGKHKEQLSSFELALRSAGIARFNLVSVSSIFPPKCKIISKQEGLTYLYDGQVVFCVMARAATNEPNRLISSSVGLAVPQDRRQFGYLSEHHDYGMTEKKASDYVEDLAAEMLATTLGLEFDPNKGYDEKREIWKISGKIVRTRSITQSAEGDKNGLWTTVVAAGIFITE
ncbi:MAG: arginine decarboxylase, pyruvoyl-dependent [candidate division Zixibacteria bacterium]|nr:arginine decarboxylase, pyruvoyl-dependent [candidate division Zixibacteria bacterium]MCI0406807.1 arginine decarboxylase, pyruvoyl-dependent [candidate division Zixibacteria bacterium]MCI0596063.1 arginine decarboxylase, pyruvoyl-dependent [candidate division Zixibacteria bacterium]